VNRTRLAAALAAALIVATGCSNEAPETAGWKTSDLKAASSPVGLGDTVAVVDGKSSDLKMVVLDAESGDVRFTRPWTAAPSYPRFSVGRPALMDGVIVGMEPDGFQTLLIARDSASGKELWKAVVSETFGPFVCGELICSEDNWSLDSAALVARDPKTGETRWTSPGSQTYIYNSPELLVETMLNEPILRSIDPATGQERWRSDLRTAMGPETRPVVSEAQLVDGTLLVESNANPQAGNATVGIDPANGSVRWKRDGFAVCPQPNPEVVLACSSGSGIQRLNPATGEPIWTVTQFFYPESAGPLLGTSADGEKVVVNETAEKLVAIGLEDGKVSEVDGGLTWMRFITGESAKKNKDAPPGEYIGPLDPVPFNAKTKKAGTVADAGDVPESVGFTLEGTRIFLNANGSLEGIPAG
jgi:outer membrane protein assembly factor BamB